MARRHLAVTAVLAVLVAYAASCAPGARSRTSPGSAAEGAARAAAAAWAQASVARDGATMGEYFADDAFVMYPQPRPTVGRAANAAAWSDVFSRPGVLHPVTSDSVVVAGSGDLAYVTGRWHLSAPASGAQAGSEVGGRYLAVWRPVGPDGAWRIVSLSANVLRPAPAM